MMHYDKYNKGQVGSILLHSDRGIDSPDTHEHSNEQIDRSRTHLNYDLKDRDGLTAYAYYKAKIDDISAKTKERTGKGIRKDAVTLCSWAVTAPQSLPEDKQSEFFEECYKWFAERYGESNIVTAAVHMDETTPHMHFQFMPIILDKNGTERLCAKDLETPKRLKTVHPKLQKYLTDKLGCPVELMNGATAGGNKTVAELKAEEAAKRAEQAEERAKAAELREEQAEQRARTAEQRAIEAESSLVNLLDGVPPLYLEEKPPKPAPPEAPKKEYYFYSKDHETRYKKAWKAYDKDKKVYDRKTLPAWERECAAIDSRNEQARQKWESTYLTADNISKAKAMVEEQRGQVEPTLARAREFEEKAWTEKEQAYAEKVRAKKERQKQAESYQNELQQAVQYEVDRLFGGVPKGREERLERFCEEITFPDGETVLDKFEQQEEERRQTLRRGRGMGRY